MANKKLIMASFNKKFDEFLGDLVNTFPEDQDFRNFKNSFNLLKNIDEKKTITIFCNYAPMYRDNVLAKNEAFFIENDYSELASKEKNITGELITKLKNYWVQLDETNREVVWKYLIILITLVDRYVAAPN